jgi:hypothetical protein
MSPEAINTHPPLSERRWREHLSANENAVVCFDRITGHLEKKEKILYENPKSL